MALFANQIEEIKARENSFRVARNSIPDSRPESRYDLLNGREYNALSIYCRDMEALTMGDYQLSFR